MSQRFDVRNRSTPSAITIQLSDPHICREDTAPLPGVYGRQHAPSSMLRIGASKAGGSAIAAGLTLTGPAPAKAGLSRYCVYVH